MEKSFFKIIIFTLLSLSFLLSTTFDNLIFSVHKPLLALASCSKDQAAPLATVDFPLEQPASLKPLLQWTKVENAVAYEIELLYTPAKDSEQIALPPNCFYRTRYIYVNGFNAELIPDFPGNFFYWRVRGLDIDANPISAFSESEKVYLDQQLQVSLKPLPTSIFNEGTNSNLLYPVYAWLPIAGAEKYEVEVLDALPENPNDIQPSIHRLDAFIATGFDYYDQQPRLSENPFYWRVRGLDHDNNPVGVYSDAGKFVVNPEESNIAIATYGDSITHGGGSVSYSPADWEYSYQSYLDFPVINLAKSGDTIEDMVTRFEADVLPFKPKYLIILAGTNSIRGGVTADEVIHDFKFLKEKCLTNNILPIFLTLPPVNPANISKIFNEDTADDWQLQRSLTNNYIRSQVHIEIAEAMEDSLGNLKNKLAVDGLHLDIVGKKLIALAINDNWKRITKLPWYYWLK